MKYQRLLKNQIEEFMFGGKVIILLGARQVGKSTLMQDILQQYHHKIVTHLTGDDPDVVEQLAGKGLQALRGLFESSDVIFIDEAQKVPDIGNTAKLLVDFYRNSKQVILTGSSSFDLQNSTSESLTGRKYSFTLFPVSFEESILTEQAPTAMAKLEQYLLYGSYPKIASTVAFEEKRRELDELTDSYLFQDILEFDLVKDSQTIRELVRALAYQIGSEVSYNELSNKLGLDRSTIIKYINLLEKSFVIFRLPALAKNKRREVFKTRKIYFYDLGIRNELIDDFRPLDLRQDKGALWENFVIAERLKYLTYHNIKTAQYFWRTYDGAEIDYIEEYPDEYKAYEIKWKQDKVGRISTKWQSYSQDPVELINNDTFLPFVS